MHTEVRTDKRMKTFIETKFFRQLKQNEFLTINKAWDLKKPGWNYIFVEEYENGGLYKYELNGRKNIYVMYYFYENKYSELNTCKICGRVSTKKNVAFRTFCHINKEKTIGNNSSLWGCYCLSCWNKQSFIERQIVHAKINKKLINQLREMKCQKKLKQQVI
jgi:hypothetical protein